MNTMNREIINSVNFSKRDAINSRNGVALQDLADGSELVVTAAAQMTVPDEETGEIKNVSVIITEDKDCYTSISSTIYDVIGDLIDIISDENRARIRINQRKSKGNNRTFLTLTIL